MESEYEGFCRGCNGFSVHLKLRPVVNKNTRTHELDLFCPECMERFGLFPYDKKTDASVENVEGGSMRVIERKPVPFYRTICPECKSEIEYTASEVSIAHIICPVCGVSMWASTVNPVRYDELKEDT